MRDPGRDVLGCLARGLASLAASHVALGAVSGVALGPLLALGAEARPYRSQPAEGNTYRSALSHGARSDGATTGSLVNSDRSVREIKGRSV